MRVVVTGATGNVGSELVAALRADPAVHEVVGVVRRPPPRAEGGVRWVAADVGRDDLSAALRGADAVVHLAWVVHPSHDLDTLWRTNVTGTAAVARAAARAGVGVLVHASSVGVYAPGPKDRAVDESWPATGVRSSWYAQHKAATERLLDVVERETPGMRVVRMRPALCLSGPSASRVRRLFVGPLAPARLLSAPPVVPGLGALRVQAVHSADAAEAYRLALHHDVRGAFNVAADPVIDPPMLSRLLRRPAVPVPAAVARAAVAASFRLHLQPTPPGWLDMALQVPLMDAGRARRDLGWAPQRSAAEALVELLLGFRHGGAGPTPALDIGRGARLREIVSGVGGMEVA